MRFFLSLIFSIATAFFVSAQANVFDLLDEPSPRNESAKISALQESPQAQECSRAVLIAVNKITATSQHINIKVNQRLFFHNMEIALHRCIKINDPYAPDAYGLVTLTEHKTNDDAKVLFQGFLIASSPSISTFNSAVYELFISHCSE
jgi:hypothetical protein